MNRERLHRQYVAERAMADRIRFAAPEQRDAVAAREYDAFFAAFGQETERMGSTLNKDAFLLALLGAPCRVVELGCGAGRTLASLAAAGHEAHGIELSERLAAAARAAVPAATVVGGSAVRFDTGGTVFDAAVSIDVIEHLHPADVPRHLDAVFRVLHPGGVYVVMTPHAALGPHDVSRFFASTPRGLHLKEYSYADMAQAATAAGFDALCGPRFMFRVYRARPAVIRFGLVPIARKIAAERVLARAPFARPLLFRLAALHTVCVVMRKPPVYPT